MQPVTITKPNTDQSSADTRAAQARKSGLREVDIRNAKPGPEPYRMNDGRGLYLQVRPTGHKTWRTHYMVEGKKHLITLGEYPAMSLVEARAARSGIRTQVREGGNPTAERTVARKGSIERNAQTFRLMATRWHEFMARTTWAKSYADAVMRGFQNDAFPAFGDRPIHAITRADIVGLLERRIVGDDTHKGSASSAGILRQNLQSVFESWLDLELIERNPAAKLARRFPHAARRNQPAVGSIEEARAVMAAVEASGTPIVRLLNRFQALTCVRPSEAREARWSEFDLVAKVWAIPAERMKGRRGRKKGHEVPLSTQALDVLAAANAWRTPAQPFVFPAVRARGKLTAVSRCTMPEVMQRALPAHLSHVPHGWRSTFSTVMNEAHPGEGDVIEAMLAHIQGGVRGIYNRATYLLRARERIQEWADLLLEGAPDAWTVGGMEHAPANVIALPMAIREAAE
jgi:integrase